MKQAEALIIGAGPSGLTAAKELLMAGAKVTLIDRNKTLGGQLIKQTHKFFGSEAEHASKRGIDIQKVLLEALRPYADNLTIMSETSVVGLYQDKVVACLKGDTFFKIRSEVIIIATGASEKSIPFENNDLPGVYAAGAVQTLMNEYGVRPGNKVLMVGSGNIGLIVSYQLMQAGIKVEALIEAAPAISGYLVHASKIRRLGVPILTRASIKRALGEASVTGAVIWDLDEAWQGIEGTERTLDVDTICISVGLAPLVELLEQIGAKVEYIRELGGNVPIIDVHYETTIQGVYACGDAAGIEEASSAMVEGKIAGLSALKRLGYASDDHEEKVSELHGALEGLRNGPHAKKVRTGYQKRGMMHD
ncbi:MAG: NAD(P)/FAD-dependent oxidoreductase [Candidatus Izemoplasmataceae bacterium]